MLPIVAKCSFRMLGILEGLCVTRLLSRGSFSQCRYSVRLSFAVCEKFINYLPRFLHVVYVCKEVISIIFLFTKACEGGYPISVVCILSGVTHNV